MATKPRALPHNLGLVSRYYAAQDRPDDALHHRRTDDMPEHGPSTWRIVGGAVLGFAALIGVVWVLFVLVGAL